VIAKIAEGNDSAVARASGGDGSKDIYTKDERESGNEEGEEGTTDEEEDNEQDAAHANEIVAEDEAKDESASVDDDEDAKNESDSEGVVGDDIDAKAEDQSKSGNDKNGDKEEDTDDDKIIITNMVRVILTMTTKVTKLVEYLGLQLSPIPRLEVATNPMMTEFRGAQWFRGCRGHRATCKVSRDLSTPDPTLAPTPTPSPNSTPHRLPTLLCQAVGPDSGTDSPH
jgi:hypothetical protein